MLWFFFFQADDGIRDTSVTGVQTCALPIYRTRGLIRICLESPNTIGVAVSASVSLTRNADRRPIPNSTNAKARCGVLASLKIGRASCRERVKKSEVEGAVSKESR